VLAARESGADERVTMLFVKGLVACVLFGAALISPPLKAQAQPFDEAQDSKEIQGRKLELRKIEKDLSTSDEQEKPKGYTCRG